MGWVSTNRSDRRDLLFPAAFRWLLPAVRWVTTQAPPALIAASNKSSGIERPLCPYPALPAYDGKGDPKALKSFSCRVAARKTN